MSWTRGCTIGRGSTATVSTAVSTFSGEVFAVKSAELSVSESLQREHKIVSSLGSCDHVIGYRGCDVSLENGKLMFNLIMDYANEGTLVDAFRRTLGGLDEFSIRKHVRGIVNGLAFLHARGIVHCDLKGSNVLLRNGGVKIADFGCAKAAEEAAVIRGTPMFMAPEVARGEEQSFPADIWALGCTVIEICTGRSPWPVGGTTLHRIAFSGEAPEFPAAVSDTCRDFLSKCLRVDPGERWRAEELLQHPFLNGLRFEKEIGDSVESPTSILNRGIWTSIEEESSEDGSGFLISPVQRVKELTMISRMEDWDWRGNWVTIRNTRNYEI